MTDLGFVAPPWAWVALTGGIVVMLAVDLLLHRDNHEIAFREAATWSRIDGRTTATLLFVVLVAVEGTALILAETPVGKLPVPITLGAIVVTLILSIAASLWTTRDSQPQDQSVPDAPTTV